MCWSCSAPYTADDVEEDKLKEIKLKTPPEIILKI